MDYVIDKCRSIIDSERFQFFIIGVIIVNAISLGLSTFSGVEDSIGPTLVLIDGICLAIYVVELLIRIVSYGRHPLDFFKSGWNIFDLVVVGSVFIPGLASQTAILRVLRVLRVARILRYLPDLQVLAQGLLKALRPLSGLLVLTIILLFLYGMAGWSFFHKAAPEYWENIGRSMPPLPLLPPQPRSPRPEHPPRDSRAWPSHRSSAPSSGSCSSGAAALAAFSRSPPSSRACSPRARSKSAEPRAGCG
ncbi:MAG: ion transporter [Solirubrobacterales bacterium]